jgi:hypothetical protein
MGLFVVIRFFICLFLSNPRQYVELIKMFYKVTFKMYNIGLIPYKFNYIYQALSGMINDTLNFIFEN